MSEHKHSAILEERYRGWQIVLKQDETPIIIQGLSKEDIAWLNTSCKATYRWVVDDNNLHQPQ